MVANTPNAVEPIFIETKGRFEGYQYAIGSPDIIGGFFRLQFENER
jgi:hypothetical protein